MFLLTSTLIISKKMKHAIEINGIKNRIESDGVEVGGINSLSHSYWIILTSSFY